MNSTRWAFMRRMRLVTPEGCLYLGRLRIVETPWFGVFLHRLDVPDPGIDLHDHPWWFASLILCGGYHERVIDARVATQRRSHVRAWRRGSIHRMPLTEAHRIYKLHRSPTWTLVLHGPRRRSWGFYLPTGYIDHSRYDFAVRRHMEAA